MRNYKGHHNWIGNRCDRCGCVRTIGNSKYYNNYKYTYTIDGRTSEAWISCDERLVEDRTKQRGGRKEIPIAEKAAICEDFFGLGKQIVEIAQARNRPATSVSAIISAYLGNGKPVTIQIPLDEENAP